MANKEVSWTNKGLHYGTKTLTFEPIDRVFKIVTTSRGTGLYYTLIRLQTFQDVIMTIGDNGYFHDIIIDDGLSETNTGKTRTILANTFSTFYHKVLTGSTEITFDYPDYIYYWGKGYNFGEDLGWVRRSNDAPTFFVNNNILPINMLRYYCMGSGYPEWNKTYGYISDLPRTLEVFYHINTSSAGAQDIIYLPRNLTYLNYGQNYTEPINYQQYGDSINLPRNLITYYGMGILLYGDISNLPRNMTIANINGNISGFISDLPSGLTELSLYSYNGNVQGSLSDLPSGLTGQLNLYVFNGIIEGPTSDLPTGLTSIASIGPIIGGNISFLSRMIGIYLFDNSNKTSIYGSINSLKIGIGDLIISTSGLLTGDLGLMVWSYGGQIQIYGNLNFTYTQNTNWSFQSFALGYCNFTTTDVDNLIIDMDNSTLYPVIGNSISIGDPRSSASDAAVASLQSKGWLIN
jgi:hypothetical protein